VNVPKLWRDLCKTCLKAGIVVPEKPEFLSLAGYTYDLPEAFLADLKFFLNGWATLPANRGVAGDGTAIDSITVTYNNGRRELFTKADESPVSD
jgi:hypothetical protein